MRSKELLIACAMVLVSLVPATAGGPDLSAYGTPVDPTIPVVPLPATRNEPPNKNWPAHVCAEIQRIEKVVISGVRPTDRGTIRIGLLMLETLHCGIDVSKKMAADEAVLEKAKSDADRAYDENMAAAAAASRYRDDPVIVEVPQGAAADPAPPRPFNCSTNRFGGGISNTTCR